MLILETLIYADFSGLMLIFISVNQLIIGINQRTKNRPKAVFGFPLKERKFTRNWC